MPDLQQDLASLRLPAGGARPRRGRRLVLVVAGVLVPLAALATWFGRGPRELEVPIVRPAALAADQRPRSTPAVTASGYVVARRKAVVSSKIQGRLATLRVEEGSRVAAGEVIATLEQAQEQAAVARAEATVLRTRAELAEQQRLHRLNARLWEQEQVVSKDTVDAAASRVATAEAALREAEAELAWRRSMVADTLIRAPFAGTVVKKMAEVGESVAPIPPGVNISTASGAIVALADLETLEVEADVNESNVARLRPEQEAEVVVEAFPERTFRAVLRQVIPSADRTRATVQVKVTILDEDERLRPEMSARVTFLEPLPPPPPGAPPALAVPAEAVLDEGDRRVVYVIEGGLVRARPVATAPGKDGRVIVTAGLDGSETLVARPPEGLSDGRRVRPAAALPAAAP